MAGNEKGKGMTYAGIAGCERMARNLMDVHGLRDWSFKWSTAKQQAGACRHPRDGQPGIIRLSKPLAELWGPDGIRDTVLHEIAHALAGPKHGHDQAWRDVCRRIGAKPDRTYEASDGRPMPASRYTGTCPDGHTVKRDRLPKHDVSCSWCAPRFDRRHLFAWSEN